MDHTQNTPGAATSSRPVRQVSDRADPRKSHRFTAAFAVAACAAAMGVTVLGASAPAVATAATTPTNVKPANYNASDDATVSAKFPTANYGNGAVLTSGSAAGDAHLIYLKFIVHALPAGSTVLSASLVLNRTAGHLLPPTVQASNVASTSWSEQTVNYQNRPAVGTSLGVLPTTPGTGRATWTAAVTGNATYAFALSSAATNDNATYNSAEGALEHPVLRLTYTPPVSRGFKVWVGATCNKPTASMATFNTCNAATGPLKFRRSFNSTLPPSFASSSAKDDAANGYRSFVSWKPPNSDYVGAAAGKYDTVIAAWARSVPRTGVYATTYHEPENDMTAAQFVAMHRHLYTVVKNANPTIQWGPVYMSYFWQPARLAGIGGARAWWVGNDRSDFTAVDNYSTPTPILLNKDPQFMTWYNFMVTTGKPLLITEYGQYSIRPGFSADPAMQAKRATTITADAAWIKSQGKIAMWLYWSGTGAQGDWSMTDAASRAAWKAVANAGRQS